MEERWLPIQGFEELYEISNLGNVKSNYHLHKGRILKNCLNSDGYPNVKLCDKANGRKKDKTYRVHRLVAIHFIPNPDNLEEVNHIDGDKRWR